MKRYASIDFLRGLAIFLMIFLHAVSQYLEIEALIADLDNIGLINIIALVILPFFGGLAGLFLLISSIGNMISMYKHLERGKSVKELIIKQVVGGFLLLIFAMIVEAIIGWNGAFGNYFKHMDDPGQTDVLKILYRWNHFETIHTIAWCVMINGLVQGLVSRNDAWKDTKKIVKIYAVLAVVVVALTQPIWSLVSYFVPGYPFAIDPETNIAIYQPVIGSAEPIYIILGPFLSALAAPMEPIFPYLAVSFIGSIIGIYLSQPRNEIPRNFPKRFFYIGLIMFITGLIGILVVIVFLIDTQGFGQAAELAMLVSNHRAWVPEAPDVPVPFMSWLWQFLCLNGFSIMATVAVIRFVEFRGKGKEFAEKTTFIRRFGFIAFTNYSIQWIYFLSYFIFTALLFNDPYVKMNWGLTFLLVFIVLAIFHLIMILWEKKRYIGSLEWMLGTIAAVLIPTKTESQETKTKWWQKGALNVEDAFYNPEWLNVIEVDEIRYDLMAESKLAFKVSMIAICSLIFMPISFVSFLIARGSKKTEGSNNYNKKASIVSIIGMILVVAFFALTAILSPSSLGISL